ARATERCAFPDATRYQLEWARLDLLTGARDADDDGDAPAAMTALQRLAHHIDVADALECVVGAAAGEFHDIRNEIALHFLRIDEVRHAEFARQRFARRVEVDAHDHARWTSSRRSRASGSPTFRTRCRFGGRCSGG